MAREASGRSVGGRRAHAVHDQHGGLVESGCSERADSVTCMMRDNQRRDLVGFHIEHRVRVDVVLGQMSVLLRAEDDEIEVAGGDPPLIKTVSHRQ